LQSDHGGNGLPGVGGIAHDAGELFVVDNTFLSPALYRPLEDGADLVIHSATKYLSGHGNLLGGIAAGSEELTGGMRSRMEHLGGVMNSHTASLLLTGVKALALRMAQHSASAIAVAEMMATHDAVEQVIQDCHPTLATGGQRR
jgi:methionine-gamma-lyase